MRAPPPRDPHAPAPHSGTRIQTRPRAAVLLIIGLIVVTILYERLSDFLEESVFNQVRSRAAIARRRIAKKAPTAAG